MATTLILGPPGTGKTTTLLDLVEESFRNGSRPDRVGFVSFTRKAVNEARARACDQFAIDQEDLVYYRTIHSLAFRQLGMSRQDVMGWKHFKELGHELGVRMTGRRLDDVGFISVGDQMVGLENRARLCCVTYKEAWEKWGGDLNWFQFDQYTRSLQRYKDAHLLYDFTDMLERFLDTGVVPDLDLLVVDEAQDLSQLQWRIVERMRAAATETYVAGDDDQAIFRWSGADVDYFLAAEFADHQQVLDQSYRLPAAIHTLAEEVSGRIDRRFVKAFHPTEKQGQVDYVASLDDADALETGDWLILVRNNYQIQGVLDHLRYCGYAYEAERDKPADNVALRAAYAWEALRAGHDVAYEDAVAVPAYLTHPVEGAPGAWDQTRPVSASDFQAVTGASLQQHWYDALGRMSVEDREYFRAARRRNENLRHPRIKVSTIHGAKGGECENVLLFTDVSNKTAQEMWRRPDDETRVFYVGVTRALSRLCIVQPQTPAHFSL